MDHKNRVNFKSILFCTTTGYFLPLFSSLLKKRREEERENEVAKPVLSHLIDLKFTSKILGNYGPFCSNV